MRKLSLLLVIGLVSAGVLGAINAGAHAGHPAVKFKSKVSINFTEGGRTGPYGQYGQYGPSALDKFTGQVKSKKRRCIKGRLVKIIKEGTGVVGKDKTNRTGAYEVLTLNPRGTYFAKAKRKKIRKANGHRIKCLRAVSRTITVP